MYKYTNNNCSKDTIMDQIVITFAVLFIIQLFCYKIFVKTDTKLQKKYDDLVYEYNTLLDDYKALQLKSTEDVKDYNKLVDEQTDLLKKYDSLLEKNSKDVDDYNALAEERDEISRNHEKDVEDYNELVDKYNALLEEKELEEKRVARLESRLSRNLSYKE